MFDGCDFDGRDGRPERRGKGGGNAATIIIVAVAASLLVTPFSLPAAIDLFRFMRGP